MDSVTSFDHSNIDVAFAADLTGTEIKFTLSATVPYVDDSDTVHCPTSYSVDFNAITDTTLGLAGACESQAPYTAGNVVVTKPAAADWTDDVDGTLLKATRFSYHAIPSSGDANCDADAGCIWTGVTKAADADNSNRKITYSASELTLPIIKNHCSARDGTTTPTFTTDASLVSGYTAYLFDIYVCSVYKAGTLVSGATDCDVNAPYVSTCQDYPQRVLVNKDSVSVTNAKSVHDTMVYLKTATLEECTESDCQTDCALYYTSAGAERTACEATCAGGAYTRRMVFEFTSYMWTRSGTDSEKIEVKAYGISTADGVTNPGKLPLSTTLGTSAWNAGGSYWIQTITTKSTCKNMIDSNGAKDAAAFTSDAHQTSTYDTRFDLDWTYTECDWDGSACTNTPADLPTVTSRTSFDPTMDPDVFVAADLTIDATSSLAVYKESVAAGNEFDSAVFGNLFREGETACALHQLDTPYHGSLDIALKTVKVCLLDDLTNSYAQALYDGSTTDLDSSSTSAFDLGCDKSAWATYIGAGSGVNPVIGEYTLFLDGSLQSNAAAGAAFDTSEQDMSGASGICTGDKNGACEAACFKIPADVLTWQFKDAPVAIQYTSTVTWAAGQLSFDTTAISGRSNTDRLTATSNAFTIEARHAEGVNVHDDHARVLATWSLIVGTTLPVAVLITIMVVRRRRGAPILARGPQTHRGHQPYAKQPMRPTTSMA